MGARWAGKFPPTPRGTPWRIGVACLPGRGEFTTHTGSENFIGSLDFLSSTGHIRAITTPNQVTVTTPQSLDSRYYTKSEIDALLVTINGYITALNASIGANATYAQGLNTRLVAVEGSALTFKGGSGATPVAVKQIHVSELPWAYYPTGQILWIEKTTPVASSPYT